MNLSTTSIFARFYVWYFNRLPVDFCSYFWNTLFAIVTLPLSAPVIIPFFDSWEGSVALRSFRGLLLYVGFTIVSGIGGMALFSLFPRLGNWWPFILGSLAFALIGGVIVGVGVGTAYTVTTVYAKIKQTETSSWIVDTYSAIRGKYCVKINWK